MSYTSWGYEFDGAYSSLESLNAVAGVYVIHCSAGENWKVLDVGQAENVRERCQTHDRKDDWKRYCPADTIHYSAHYMPGSTEPQRIQVEQQIRRIANPPCGEK